MKTIFVNSLKSILNQTYRNIEILLIGDGSPDKCCEICEEYAQIDNHIRVFHTENKGLPAARNLGLLEAKGEYIGFVDSDAWIEPDMYEVLLQRLEEIKADISVCDIYINYKSIYLIGNNVPNAVFAGINTIRALVSFTFLQLRLE